MALGAGVYIFAGGLSVFADNLVFANSGSDAGAVAVLQASGEGHVNRNTIVSNSTDTLDYPGGLFISGSANFYIGNNIVWNNAAPGGSNFESGRFHSERERSRSHSEGKGIEAPADRRTGDTTARGRCDRIWPCARPLDAGRCQCVG